MGYEVKIGGEWKEVDETFVDPHGCFIALQRQFGMDGVRVTKNSTAPGAGIRFPCFLYPELPASRSG